MCLYLCALKRTCFYKNIFQAECHDIGDFKAQIIMIKCEFFMPYIWCLKNANEKKFNVKSQDLALKSVKLMNMQSYNISEMVSAVCLKDEISMAYVRWILQKYELIANNWSNAVQQSQDW